MTGAGSALLSISTLGQGGATNYLRLAAVRRADDPGRRLRRDVDQPHAGARRRRRQPVLQLRLGLAAHLQRQLDQLDHGRLRRRRSRCSARRRARSASTRRSPSARTASTPPRRGSAYHEGTPADPSSAQVGDYLWYRLALTNSGTVALTPSLTDAGCDLPASPTPIEKTATARTSPTRRPPRSTAATSGPTSASTSSRPAIPTRTSTPSRPRASRTLHDARGAGQRQHDQRRIARRSRRASPARSSAAHRVDLLVGGVVKAASVGDDGATPAQSRSPAARR